MTKMTSNPTVLAWVEEKIALLNPDTVEWIDGSEEQLDKLRGLDVHSTVILSQVDENTFSRLGVNLTCEPKYQTSKLYHR